MLHFNWKRLSSACGIFSKYCTVSKSTSFIHAVHFDDALNKAALTHSEPTGPNKTLWRQPAHGCSSSFSKVRLPWQTGEADSFSGFQCCWSLLGSSDPREAAAQRVLSSEQPGVSCSPAMKPPRRVLSNLRAQSYCVCHALMAAWLTIVEIIQWVKRCSDLFSAWVCAHVRYDVRRKRRIVFASKIKPPLRLKQIHWRQTANTCWNGTYNNGAILFSGLPDAFSSVQSTSKYENESFETELVTGSFEPFGEKLDRLLQKVITAGCGRILFTVVPMFSPMEASTYNQILYIYWAVIMHARTSDSHRAVWPTSESALFLSSAPSTIPQPQDSWRRCTFAGYICSSMSSNHGNTTWPIFVWDRLRPIKNEQNYSNNKQQSEEKPMDF